MKSYSKGKLNLKRFLIVLSIILVIAVISVVWVYFYVKHKNYFNYEKLDSAAMYVSDDVAKNSYPIVIDNIVIGAVYNEKWVSSARYKNNSVNKVGTELDLFSLDGKYGTFKITDIKNIAGNIILYTEKPNYTNEYYAVKKDSIKYPLKVYNVDSDESYVKIASKALNKYKFLNDSVKINKIYGVSLNNKDNGYIITVTSDKKVNNYGAYSAVIYSDNFGNSNIIKYNYVSNTKDSEKFNIYDVKFVADFNNDGMNDIVLIETNEFETKYSIVEKRNNKFVEVLSCNID